MSEIDRRTQSTTFSSMGEEFFDMRFSRDSRQLFEEQIDAIEAISSSRTYDIPVTFFGRFDEKSQMAIKILVNEVIQNANKYELKLHQTDPAIEFYTLASWEDKLGKSYEKKINLPASKIKWENGTPFIQLIIPEKISSSEAVIKTVRLLFSKIYGKLFFDEHVPGKSAFRLLPDEKEAVEVDTKEKVHFCYLLGKYPPALLKEFELLAAKFGMKGQKARDHGEKEFFKIVKPKNSSELSSDEESSKGLSLSAEYAVLIEETFQQNLKDLRSDPTGFFDHLSDKIFTLIPQSTLLLPYDLQKFKFLKENRQWTLFHALDERLQLTLNIINELEDCRSFLDEKESNKPLDYQISDLWLKSLNQRLLQLKKKGLVKLFLTADAKLTEKQQKEKEEFPFWIWRHGLLKNFPAGSQPEKMIKRITEQYQNSIYQKLFETTFRMIQTIKRLEKDETSTFAQCPDFSTIKSLFVWLNIRIPGLEDLLYSCKVGSQVSVLAKKKGITKKKALHNFEQGWSYFVSFALVHKYYRDVQQKKGSADKRADQFLSVIEKFTKNRLEAQPFFQIANLLIQIYKQREFDLSKVIPLIVKDAPIVDFFVINQKEIFKTDAQMPEQIIEHYCISVLKWQEQAVRNAVSQQEIDSLNAPIPL